MRSNLNSHTKQQIFSERRVRIDYVGASFTDIIFNEFSSDFEINNSLSFDFLYSELQERSFLELPDVLLLEVDEEGKCFSFIEGIKKLPMLQGLLIFLLSRREHADWKEKAKELKVEDYYIYPFNVEDLNERIKFMVKLRIISSFSSPENDLPYVQQTDLSYKMPLSKRLFDILVSSIALLFLSPVFLITAIIIRLESKGSVIYKSKRAGTGYKVFDFYKFRSMRTDADSQLSKLSELNQYTSNGKDNKSAFIKIVNDPRVTKVGNFIRKTSIDELPQLFNILIGDMSFVGNRPLPLYEAEQLTSNEWAMRFLGPAGLTGLWQISKRGKKDISERERKKLDNYYARQHSFLLDLKIILKTFPALIQKEKV